MKLLRVVLIASVLLLVCSAASAQTQHSVDLSWTASTTANVTYNMYRSTVTGGPYSRISLTAITGTTYTDASVTGGVTYFYVVTAYDGANESAYSNEAKAVIPSPPNAATNLRVTGVR